MADAGSPSRARNIFGDVDTSPVAEHEQEVAANALRDAATGYLSRTGPLRPAWHEQQAANWLRARADALTTRASDAGPVGDDGRTMTERTP